MIRDDGSVVTLDLHGASVEEAARLACRAIAEARRRGRSSVTIIHGSSTSAVLYRNQTIKHRLHELADGGGLGEVAYIFKGEDALTVSLSLGTASDRRPIRLLDL